MRRLSPFVLLLLLSAFGSANAARLKAGTITGSNNAWSAATALGFSASHLRACNEGAVPARIGFDGTNAAFRMKPNECRTYRADSGSLPSSIYAYGEAGAPTVQYEAAAYNPVPSGGEQPWLNVDATSLTYGAAVIADWDGNVDPGDVDDALDQLAERAEDVDAQILILGVTVNAEAANVVTVDIAVTDGAGNAVAAAQTLKVGLYDGLVGETIELDAAYTVTDGGDGSIEDTDTGKARHTVTTTAAGLASLDVTDVVGGTNTSVYLYVELINTSLTATKCAAPVRVAVPFDAV